MSWQVLLIIALVGLVVVLVVAARAAFIAWRLLRHWVAVLRRLIPLVTQLSQRADEMAAAGLRLTAAGETLATRIADLQHSMARLQVIAGALGSAITPLLLVSRWLSGDSDGGELRRWSSILPR
jgi:hypothetical protein